MVIIISSDEPADMIAHVIAAKIPFEVKKLAVGDVGYDYTKKDHSIRVERKDVDDLWSSLLDGRFDNQIYFNKPEGKWESVLIIEGDYGGLLRKHSTRAGWIISSISRAKWTAHWKVIFTKDKRETVNELKNIDKYFGEVMVEPPPKKPRSTDKRIRILMGYEQLGEKRALKAINKYHSIGDFINAPKEELQELFGPNIGESVHEQTWKRTYDPSRKYRKSSK